MQLIDHILKTVDPREYYNSLFDDLRWPSNDGEARIKSPFRDEKTPSFSINPKTGAWYDHGTGHGGKSIVSFTAEYHDIPRADAAREIYNDWIRPTISGRKVTKHHRALLSTPSFLRILSRDRLLSADVIDQFQLGTNGQRITIPIFDQFGNCVNIKLYLPGGSPKMLNYTDRTKRKYGNVMIYPLSILHLIGEGPVFVCEGELDALALISLGLCAVSSTAGCKSWAPEYNYVFRGRDIIVCYDNDKDGTTYDRRIVKELKSTAKSIKRLHIPKAVGKDVTDWLVKKPSMRNAEAWLSRGERSKLLIENADEFIVGDKVQAVTLNQASESQYTGREIEVNGLITGKDTSPYIIPRKARISCDGTCEVCPLKQKDFVYREVEIKDRAEILKTLTMTQLQTHNGLIAKSGIHPDCAQIEITENQNVERMVVIPTIDSNEPYVMRHVFTLGHGTRSNRSYRMQGTTLPDPKTQEAVHIFNAITPIQSEAETFELSAEDHRALELTFQQRRMTVGQKLKDIADWQSRHITKIRERPDLHTIVDLAFHSVSALVFNGEPIDRGMLDVLVIGDTRCGKGYVTERLVKHYGLGEVASGENCSFAGLVGGCESIGKRFIVKWGVIPLNNGRIVVIDEASALKLEDFGALSRVRSEGIAEINKIVREHTVANTRLVWLSNSRTGKSVDSYTNGVTMIPELVGNAEDVSRFDVAMVVATGEVGIMVINTDEQMNLYDPDKYPRELFRKLILWAWSRKPEDIKILDSAQREVIRCSIRLGQKYNPQIPLVQAENIRIKLVKLACAVAARVYSSPDGNQLAVTINHVRYAYNFMCRLYDKPSMGYNVYSRDQSSSHEKQEDTNVVELMERLGEHKNGIVRMLRTNERFTRNMVMDFTGGDMLTAMELISILNDAQCIKQNSRNLYTKLPWFTEWLKENT